MKNSASFLSILRDLYRQFLKAREIIVYKVEYFETLDFED